VSFLVGDFDRSRAGALRKFCPWKSARVLQDVSLDMLWDAGKRLILLDVDHTIVKWHEEEFSAEVLDWVAAAKARGFQLRILSNTRHPQRLARLSAQIGIPTKNGKFKPSPEMYKEALKETGIGAEQAVMIGDQIMTDILGANRTGIDGIWLQKMDGPEFAGTKINRVIERIIMSVLYRTLVPSSDEATVAPNRLLDRPIVRQFAKFLAVGALSFLIDTSIRLLLMRKLHIGSELASTGWGQGLMDRFPNLVNWYASEPSRAFAPVAFFCGSFIATFNSFLLNRYLTFKIKEKTDAGKQLLRVLLVSYTGLAINVVISSLFFGIIPGHKTISLVLASVIGAGVAAFWNFAGQKYFAFRVHERP